MKDKIVESFFITAVGIAVSFLAPFIFLFFWDNTPEAKVGNQIKIAENQYLLPIELTTYRNEINELRINVPFSISESQIKSDYPLTVTIVTNNVQTAIGTDIAIKNITSNKNIQLAIETTGPVNSELMEITNRNDKINVSMFSDRTNPATSQVKRLLQTAIIYGLIFLGYTTFNKYDTLKKTKSIKEELNIHKVLLNNEIANIKEQKIMMEKQDAKMEVTQNKLDKVVSDTEKMKINHFKRSLLLKAKLYDYQKELNFWRNTIRKILYQNKVDKNEAEKIIDTVTHTLKTYQTKEKNEYELEEMKVLGKYMNEMEDIEKNI